jgi:hypothetical protein
VKELKNQRGQKLTILFIEAHLSPVPQALFSNILYLIVNESGGTQNKREKD